MRRYILLLFPLLVLLGACEQTAFDPIGEPFSKVEGLATNWTLQQVVQVDYLTNKFENSQDISYFVVGSQPPQLDFKAAGSYTASYGDSPLQLFGESGTWAFDDVAFPTKLTLTPTGGQAIAVDLLASTRISDPELSFEMPRNCRGTLSMSYQFTFSRTNQ